MERIENYRAFLDRGAGVCAVFADDAEIEVTIEAGNRTRGQAGAGGGTGPHGHRHGAVLRGAGRAVTATEERPESEIAETAAKLRAAGVTLELGGHGAKRLCEQDLIVPSPGVPPIMPALAAARAIGVPVWSEIELAWRFLRGRLICITGSNGKTTTTSLIGHILETAGLPVQVAGNIGTPLISRVDVSSDAGFTVVEASSFQLESISAFRPDVAVLLNLTPDHLDRHGSFEAYGRAKRACSKIKPKKTPPS
jgi:UDP-N-acetylmuramoylalanine--D-glutamate ligase